MSDLTDIDRRLIYGLDFKARQPLAHIANKLRVSKQLLSYRFEKLQKENIIQGFYTDINPSKLNLVIYLVYFKFQHISAEKEVEFITHLNSNEHIGVNATVHGKWDHSIAIMADDIQEFKRIYEKVMLKYEQYIKEKLITIVTEFWYYKPKYLLPEKDRNDIIKPHEIVMHGPLESVKIDDKDRQMLKILADSARMPLVDLAKKVDLTPNAVKARLKALEKKEIILGYRIMLNHMQLNKLHYRIFFFLENKPEEQERFRQFLAQQPQVISITKTIGYCDVECRMYVDDIAEFYSFMARIKTRFSTLMKDFEPIMYYKFHKSLNYYPIK